MRFFLALLFSPLLLAQTQELSDDEIIMRMAMPRYMELETLPHLRLYPTTIDEMLWAMERESYEENRRIPAPNIRPDMSADEITQEAMRYYNEILTDGY